MRGHFQTQSPSPWRCCCCRREKVRGDGKDSLVVIHFAETRMKPSTSKYQTSSCSAHCAQCTHLIKQRTPEAGLVPTRCQHLVKSDEQTLLDATGQSMNPDHRIVEDDVKIHHVICGTLSPSSASIYLIASRHELEISLVLSFDAGALSPRFCAVSADIQMSN